MGSLNKFVALIIFTFFSCNSLFGIEANEHELTTSQIIEKAHKHDNMWASDENADQKKALEYYNAALESGPDDEQRLHILYRMAQLYGSAYQLEKGEKPDFHKAIELNGEIVKSFPQTEPLVFKALISLGDHHVTLREFDKGLEYFKQALEYDISDLIQLRDNAEDEEEIRLLEGNISRIKQFQKIAVDQVGYCATFVDPVCARGAFRNIAETHSQSFIREYAAEKMSSSMDEFSDLWAPTLSMGDKSFIVKTQRSIPVKKTVAPPKQIQVDSSSEQKSQTLSSVSLEAHARASPSKTKLLFYLFTGILIVLILGFSGMVIKKRKNTINGRNVL